MNALTRDLVNLVNTAEENQTAKEQTSGTQFREKLHLMPPVGWLNDPNGLCQMDGVFHAFFQYSPFNAEGGVKMWGHYTSTNLIDWEYKGVSLYRISHLTATVYIPDLPSSKTVQCIFTTPEMSSWKMEILIISTPAVRQIPYLSQPKTESILAAKKNCSATAIILLT